MIRTLILGLAMSATVLGCGHPPDPQFRARMQGPLAMGRGRAVDFVPLVPASAQRPTCEDLHNVPEGMGSRVVSYVYGSPPEQRIAVVLDEEGKVRSYSDMRGDLTASDQREGDVTTIAVNLVQGHGVAQNRPERGEPESVRLELADALDAPSLGEPRRRIEEILATCAR